MTLKRLLKRLAYVGIDPETREGRNVERGLASSVPRMRLLCAILAPQRYCLASRVVYWIHPLPMSLVLVKL